MKKLVCLLFCIYGISSFVNASLIIMKFSEKKFYWECSITPDANTGIMQFIRGDGKSEILVRYNGAYPYSIVEGNQKYNLSNMTESNGWTIFDTQYPLQKVWVNEKYVLLVTYFGGQPIYMARYNPQKGVISGTQDGLNPNSGGFSNGGNYNNGGSSGGSRSDGYTCPTCHGTGRCTSCAGRGEWRGNDGRLYDCSMCHGGGACYGCHGRGTIR